MDRKIQLLRVHIPEKIPETITSNLLPDTTILITTYYYIYYYFLLPILLLITTQLLLPVTSRNLY